ncbi:hypothetical protein PsalN5692_03899 (plasmid) [Piscirickettsia salmonis]|uniref:hypothetical protein n=1 Tax=Piscirickettsia salmonis TaxID=1238 RepID=UPI0007C930F6|nr:hypothetical protein [Piscirickettsia salmonis]OAJ33099.1 hypothetical protein A0O36_02706 [Piscirickettsiaceae bacterium NZ-RLO1]QGP52390.1 hypothetical protein PsalN5692_03899 [Piscirickettsia salmonis]
MQSEKESALIIERSFINFIQKCKKSSDDARVLSETLGKKIIEEEMLNGKIFSGGVFVQIRGLSGNPLFGHSSFHFFESKNDISMHTYCLNRNFPDKVPKNSSRAQYIFKTKTPSGKDISTLSFIHKTAISKGIDKLKYMCKEGSLYWLNITQCDFEMVIKAEESFFKSMPYSYGLHYNCNTFVCNVLHRVFKQKIISNMTSATLLFDKHRQTNNSGCEPSDSCANICQI